MRNPVNPINFSMNSLELASPGFEGLSEFEVDNIRNLRKAAGSIALAPTQMELQAHQDKIAALNYEFVSSIPEILPSATITSDTYREPAGDFKLGARVVLRNLGFGFENRSTTTISQNLAEELSALRAGLVWLDVKTSAAIKAQKTRSQRDTYFSSKVSELPVPYFVVGAHPTEDGYANVAFLSANTRSSRFDADSNVSSTPFFRGDIFNDRFTSLRDEVTLFAKRSIIVARMRQKQLHNLETLQGIMLGDGLSQDELVGIKQADKLVVSPDTVPVFRARNRLPHLLRLYNGPKTPEAIDSKTFSIDVLHELNESISPETFKDFSMMRWIHRTAVFFNREADFTARVNKYTTRLPEDPTAKYLRENS